jgi:hypothetical protein
VLEHSPILSEPLDEKLASRIQFIGAYQKLEILYELSGR